MYDNMSKEQEFIMKKNRLKLGFGILTVLAAPIAVNTIAGTEAPQLKAGCKVVHHGSFSIIKGN